MKNNRLLFFTVVFLIFFAIALTASAQTHNEFIDSVYNNRLNPNRGSAIIQLKDIRIEDSTLKFEMTIGGETNPFSFSLAEENGLAQDWRSLQLTLKDIAIQITAENADAEAIDWTVKPDPALDLSFIFKNPNWEKIDFIPSEEATPQTLHDAMFFWIQLIPGETSGVNLYLIRENMDAPTSTGMRYWAEGNSAPSISSSGSFYSEGTATEIKNRMIDTLELPNAPVSVDDQIKSVDILAGEAEITLNYLDFGKNSKIWNGELSDPVEFSLSVPEIFPSFSRIRVEDYLGRADVLQETSFTLESVRVGDGSAEIAFATKNPALNEDSPLNRAHTLIIPELKSGTEWKKLTATLKNVAFEFTGTRENGESFSETVRPEKMEMRFDFHHGGISGEISGEDLFPLTAENDTVRAELKLAGMIPELDGAVSITFDNRAENPTLFANQKNFWLNEEYAGGSGGGGTYGENPNQAPSYLLIIVQTLVLKDKGIAPDGTIQSVRVMSEETELTLDWVDEMGEAGTSTRTVSEPFDIFSVQIK